MRMSQAFPSAYVKAADLFDGKGQPRRVKLKINRVEMEDVGDDNKPVIHFIGTDKKLVLNKTNTSEIVEAYGDESDDWHDKIIEIYPARVEYAGKKMWGIRVNAMFEGIRQAQAAQAPLVKPPVNGAPFGEFVDEIEAPPIKMMPAVGAKDPFDVDEIPF